MLKITDLYAKVEGKDILKGINLTVNPGEIHAIMGPQWIGQKYIGQCSSGKYKL
jgi:Fe-S cluster assembly ATP-binding protein